MRLVPDASYTMDEYCNDATETASYPDLGNNMIYPALGLTGEAGELAEKVKKLWRNKGIKSGLSLNTDERENIVKELGDVLWYIAAMCGEINVSLNHVASVNIEKLRDRRERNVIKSEGDNR